MDHKEKIDKCDIYLKDMFNELVSDKTIKKVRLDNIMSEDDKIVFDLFVDKKSFHHIFYILVVMHFMLACSIAMPLNNAFNNGDFSRNLLIFLISFALITSVIGVKIIKKRETKWRKRLEEKLQYCRDDLITQFINNNLMFREEYLENKKFGKKNLQKTINFIQENLSKEELIEFLIVSKTEDITDPNNVFLLMQEIRNKHLNAILAEENKNERNIDKMLNATYVK